MRHVSALTTWLIALVAVTVLPHESSAASCPTNDKSHELIYIGTHNTIIPPPGFRPPGMPADRKFTPDTRPGGKGVYAACFDERKGTLTPIGLAANVERPTWLAVNPLMPILYTVSEVGNDGHTEASVYSFSIEPRDGTLRPLNHVGSGGGGATHLAIDPASHTLFVANFGTGQVASLPLNTDGSLAPAHSVQADYGTGPKPRQKGPHAHAVAVDPSGRFVLSADLGADRIFVYHFDPASKELSPADPPFEALPPGSGPRHLVFLPNGKFLYMNTELGAEIVAFRWDAALGHLQPIQALSLLSPSFTEEKSAAELAVSRDGRFVYVSNRGEDTIVVFAVDQSTGKLTEVQRIAAGGKTPWSFTIDPAGHWMIVANEGSSTLNVMEVDPATGKLSPTENSMSVPKPVSIAFYPR